MRQSLACSVPGSDPLHWLHAQEREAPSKCPPNRMLATSKGVATPSDKDQGAHPGQNNKRVPALPRAPCGPMESSCLGN
eukprot:5956892-Prymnesium_polylepis.1